MMGRMGDMRGRSDGGWGNGLAGETYAFSAASQRSYDRWLAGSVPVIGRLGDRWGRCGGGWGSQQGLEVHSDEL
jgi:hypothetical protein